MPQRVKSMLAVFVVAWACAIATLILHCREPVYGGKGLSLWVQEYESGKDCRAVDEAVRNIGSNGLPMLLAMIKAQDHPVWSNVVRFANQHGLKRLKYIPARTHHERALFAFHALGASASNAVPKLLKMYRRNPCVEPWAGQALGQIGPAASNAVPFFLVNLGNTNRQVRAVAARALGGMHCCATSVVPALTKAMDDSESSVRYEAFLALAPYGEEAKSAAPALLHYLENNCGYPGAVMWALSQVHADTPMILNVLRKMLHDAKLQKRLSGVWGLQAMGKDARTAVPDLLQMLDEQDVRREVIAALKAIDPAAAVKASVNEQPSAPL